VIVAFQIGGYKPCTVTDFDLPKKVGLRQTIADTLGIGGIMRGLRTVPHLWKLAEDMRAVCPQAIMLQYVNPMAINTWALGREISRHQAGGPLPFGPGHRRGTGP
jgi:alpha-galactosidase